MAEDILQFLCKQLLVLLQISVDHFDHLLECVRPVIWVGHNNVFGHWVGPSVWWVAFIFFNIPGNNFSSDDWSAHGSGERNFPLFLGDDEEQGLDELPVIVHRVGHRNKRMSRICADSNTTTGISDGRSRSSKLSRCCDWYCFSRVAMAWWLRWRMGVIGALWSVASLWVLEEELD